MRRARAISLRARRRLRRRVQAAPPRQASASLHLSAPGLDFIKAWESYRRLPYDDSEGYCTVGYGHLLGRRSCAALAAAGDAGYAQYRDGIAASEAAALLRDDSAGARTEVLRVAPALLAQQEFDALLSLAFNTGSLQKFPKLRACLEAGDYAGACAQFADITNGGVRGLVRRRRAEMNLFRNGVYDASHLTRGRHVSIMKRNKTRLPRRILGNTG